MKSTTATGKLIEGIKILGSLAFILLLLIVIVAWVSSRNSNGNDQTSSQNPSISTQQYGGNSQFDDPQFNNRMDQLKQKQQQERENQAAQSRMDCLQSNQEILAQGRTPLTKCY
jgi:hypothetical protein